MKALERLLEVGTIEEAHKIIEETINEKMQLINNAINPVEISDLPFLIMAIDKMLEAIKIAHPVEQNVAEILNETFMFETIYINVHKEKN